MPRFVLLYHDCPTDNPRESHCDLMLEKDGALRTWALPELPCAWGATVGRVPPGCSIAAGRVRFAPSNTVPADQLSDHRITYLDYQGPVSGGRGTVTRIDSGQYVRQEGSPDRWVLEVTGQFIAGQITLRRLAPDAPAWQLKFEAASPISAD